MPEPTPEAWVQIRYDYEHTDRPVVEICLEQRITANTLRLRARRWGWRMRRARIPAEGPPAVFVPAVHHAPPPHDAETAAFPAPILAPDIEPSPHIASPATADTRPIGDRLQGAVARVVPAIEMTLARLSAGPMHPREMELAARALGSLMRALRELNGLLIHHRADEPRRSTEELRQSVARKLEAIIAERDDETPRRYLAGWEEFAAEAKQTAEPVL